ncbi:oligosaccharide flippase family protein [uncultured Treponema sp.]|uniref:lipopolysaccharide biosynthesis protein n=1 Tax=uncultured Treponema sp. TaxID=162155 RepID=UPI0025E468CF|nr:oligosaccharide flippase family protein [uncultured Treponema sp.]
MNRKLFSNTILYTVGEVVPRIISFLMMPIFTRYLSPADYGILSYTNSVIAFIYVLCTLALNTYVLRFFFDCKTKEERKKLLGNIFVFIAIINFAVLALFHFTGPFIIEKAKISVPWKPYFRLAILNNFLESFSIIPMLYYRIKQNAKMFVGISLGRCILQYVATFVMLVALGWGVMSQYYGRLITLLPFFVIYIIIMLRHTKMGLDWRQLKQGLKFSLPLLPGSVSYLVLTSLDKVILERYVSLEIIGIYNIAYTIAFAMNMIIQSFYKALEPSIFQKYNENPDIDAFVPYMKKINNIYNFALYALALILSLFAKEALMIIAGEKYYSAAFYVPLVLIGVIFSGRNVFIECALTAEKRSIINGIGTMVGSIVSITTNLILIPKIGVVAATIALSFSYLIMNIYFKVCTKIKFFNNWQDIVGMLVFLSCSIIPLCNFSLSEIVLIRMKLFVYLLAIVILMYNYHIFAFFKNTELKK